MVPWPRRRVVNPVQNRGQLNLDRDAQPMQLLQQLQMSFLPMGHRHKETRFRGTTASTTSQPLLIRPILIEDRLNLALMATSTAIIWSTATQAALSMLLDLVGLRKLHSCLQMACLPVRQALGLRPTVGCPPTEAQKLHVQGL